MEFFVVSHNPAIARHEITIDLLHGLAATVIFCECGRESIVFYLGPEEQKDFTCVADKLDVAGWEWIGTPCCPKCKEEREEAIAEAEREADEQERYYEEEHRALAAEGVRACKKGI